MIGLPNVVNFFCDFITTGMNFVKHWKKIFEKHNIQDTYQDINFIVPPGVITAMVLSHQ